MSKKLFYYIVMVLSAALFVGSFSLYHLSEWGKTPIVFDENKGLMELKSGMKLQDLSDILEQNGLVTSSFRFRWQVKLLRNYSLYKAGKYKFSSPVAPDDIIRAMVEGRTYEEIVFQITFPEGFNTRQIAQKIYDAGLGSTKAQIFALMSNKAFIESFPFPEPKPKTLEGFIFPATYNFSEIPTAKKILQEAVSTFFKKLPPDYLTQAQALGLDLYQAVNIASLIELETAQDEELTRVSEVIWRRLKSHMALGIDAALIYGIKNYNGDIKTKDLRDKSNVYNTRIYPGLPPTPICSPSIAALLATLSPSNEGYLYYVVDPNRPRFHIFSRTLDEHNENVGKFLKSQGKKFRKPNGKK